MSRLRVRLGVQTGAHIAKDVLREAKAKAHTMLTNVWLPNRVVVSMSPSEYDRLGPARDQLARDVRRLLDDAIKPDLRSGERSHYYLASAVEVTLRRDPTVRPGAYPIEAWIEGSESTATLTTSRTAADVGPEATTESRCLLRVDGDTPRLYPLKLGASVIGRAANADVRIPFDTVSSQHARVFIELDGRFAVEDLGSRNGTFVSGRRISSRTDVGLDEPLGFGTSVQAAVVAGPCPGLGG